MQVQMWGASHTVKLCVDGQTQTSVLLSAGSADGPAIVAADEEHGCAQSAGKVDSSMEISL